MLGMKMHKTPQHVLQVITRRDPEAVDGSQPEAGVDCRRESRHRHMAAGKKIRAEITAPIHATRRKVFLPRADFLRWPIVDVMKRPAIFRGERKSLRARLSGEAS